MQKILKLILMTDINIFFLTLDANSVVREHSLDSKSRQSSVSACVIFFRKTFNCIAADLLTIPFTLLPCCQILSAIKLALDIWFELRQNLCRQNRKPPYFSRIYSKQMIFAIN